MLIAPTEPPKLRAIGKTSSIPERYGVDILFPTPQGLAGIQRKELSDYIASIHDGRLGKEIVQMQQLGFKALILEGKVQWTNEGSLMSGRVNWSRSQHTSSLMAVQNHGIRLFSTDSLSDTIHTVTSIESWLQKTEHSSFLNRPNPKGKWGRATNKDWACHLLQSFEGVGLSLAEAIYTYFQDQVPLKWTCTAEELRNIPGIGPKRIAALLGSLSTKEKNDATSSNSELPTEYEIAADLKG